MFRTSVAALIPVAPTAAPDAPSERIDHEVNARIRQAGHQGSQITRTMHHLTDVHGPRLTGVEYQADPWHTNPDTYRRIIEADVQKSAIPIAAAVYHLARRDETLPRFTPEQMRAARPAPTPPTSGTVRE